MRLVNTKYDIEIKFEENLIYVLDIENSEVLVSFMQNLWMQSNGERGDFILSENEREFKIEKKIECIYNPFEIDINNKKIITKLYSDMEEVSKDELYEIESEVNTVIVKYLDCLSKKFDYPVDYRVDLDMKGLLKMYDFKLQYEEKDFTSKLFSYVKLMHRICGIEVFVLYNIKSFIPQNITEKFYKELLYEKIFIILIEDHQSESNMYEKRCIIDKDLCIIDIN